MNELSILNLLNGAVDEILNDSTYLLACGATTKEKSEKRAYRLIAGLEYVISEAVKKGYLSEVIAELAYTNLNEKVEENISNENATLF